MWMQVNQEATAVIAADPDFGLEAFRVFTLLCARLDFENWIRVPQTELAEALGMKRPNVSRAVKLLERKGIILPGPKVDRSSVWRLNPHYGWKGKVVNFQQAQRERHLQLVKSATEGSREAQQQPSADDRQLPLF
jgi:DNA-binding IclR family transcriptional regulator